MSNTVVSVRIPAGMIKELKTKVETNHFLDLSEAVRSIVRKRWMEYKDPSAYQVKKLRQDITSAVKESTKKSKQDRLLSELERIKDLLTEEVQK